MLSARFWGVRGSIPCPGINTVVFGGNTACIEIRADERLIIVDMGTGIRPLGDWLMVHDLKEGPITADIFITHTHWDHIMGFPVFNPMFIPTSKFHIRGPVSYEDETLMSILSQQLSYRYWPVRLHELAAQIEYSTIHETSLDLGRGLKVVTKYLNHPILCLGYRFEYQGKSIVTAYDFEPYRNIFPVDKNDSNYDEAAAREGETAAQEENGRVLKFFKDADVLIYDTHYTAVEYESKKGWGHSTFEQAIIAAREASVKRLVCFHHDPNRTDSQLEELEDLYRTRIRHDAPAGKWAPDLLMAREGLTIEA
ncbi:MAG: MBL fold metallo-hydrolase [Treponema sp.]|jgi:phosphoribosyl 1,2-cyclic phosphodiesterase|nr:MBL fold metallo-hydrolase [Treponema sp.]